MTDLLLAHALEKWGLDGAQCELAANRENTVYRIKNPGGNLALRLHRPGLRTAGELSSELEWMAYLQAAGLTLPRPVPSKAGLLLEEVEGVQADVLTWLEGKPMGSGGNLADLDDPLAAYHSLGVTLARLHERSDSFVPKQGFSRPSWDCEGLVGEQPLWGRFWENPTLSEDQSALLKRARDQVRDTLAGMTDKPDYGLIHADPVPENVLLSNGIAQLIDFDDGGFGFRLFDLATAINRGMRVADWQPLRDAFLDGYLGVRSIDLAHLDLFCALRSFTYVGWIVPRLAEQSAAERNARFIDNACRQAARLLAE